jgi:hypothetical protein
VFEPPSRVCPEQAAWERRRKKGALMAKYFMVMPLPWW